MEKRKIKEGRQKWMRDCVMVFKNKKKKGPQTIQGMRGQVTMNYEIVMVTLSQSKLLASRTGH